MGSYFYLNLFLVVIAMKFEGTKANLKKEFLRKQKTLEQQCASNNQLIDMTAVKTSAWEKILQTCGKLIFKILYKIYKPAKSDNFAKNPNTFNTSLKMCCFCCFERISSYQVFKSVFDFRENIKEFIESKYFQLALLCAILLNTLSMAIEHHNQVIKLNNSIIKQNFKLMFKFKVSTNNSNCRVCQSGFHVCIRFGNDSEIGSVRHLWLCEGAFELI